MTAEHVEEVDVLTLVANVLVAAFDVAEDVFIELVVLTVVVLCDDLLADALELAFEVEATTDDLLLADALELAFEVETATDDLLLADTLELALDDEATTSDLAVNAIELALDVDTTTDDLITDVLELTFEVETATEDLLVLLTVEADARLLELFTVPLELEVLLLVYVVVLVTPGVATMEGERLAAKTTTVVLTELQAESTASNLGVTTASMARMLTVTYLVT